MKNVDRYTFSNIVLMNALWKEKKKDKKKQLTFFNRNYRNVILE